ncbi:MAG: ATP-dependent DNA helicase PcrA [Myxococcales bacterium FL481]|nr:MAG: ATP-dependent DNA helicase PcrA [Myxococcales bacterium FL481]
MVSSRRLRTARTSRPVCAFQRAGAFAPRAGADAGFTAALPCAAVSLNAEQKRAVAHRGSSLLVLAGAGTGKTRVITHRVAALIEDGVEPWRILAVTFTNKAAGEMRERVHDLGHEMGISTDGLWVGTFHATCARILRRYGEAVGLSRSFTIYDATDQRTLMNRVLKELDYSTSMFPTAQVLGYVDRAKNRGIGPASVSQLDLEEPLHTVVSRAYARYQERLRAADAADFGDLLNLTLEVLRNETASRGQLAREDEAGQLAHRFQHVVVDEYQDTNAVQAELVDRLATRAELCVVGDDDQAIYGWRGADVAQILGFSARHEDCEIIRLEQNYRSTGHVLSCADGIIAANHRRHGKTLWTDADDGPPIRVCRFDDQRDEAAAVVSEIVRHLDDGVDPEEMVVFFRTNAQSRPFEEALREVGVGYRVLGGMRFFDRQEIKDLVAYLRLLDTPTSDLDLERAINRPARGIGQKSVDALRRLAASESQSLHWALGELDRAELGAAARKRVAAFADLLARLRQDCEGLALPDVARVVLEASGYWEALGPNSDIEAASRRDNLDEFINALAEFTAAQPEATLSDYLDTIALASSEDDADARQVVTLMTIHAGKGLEFDHVYVTGMEEGVFPHVRSLDDPTAMDEERRLAYVAVTRSRRYLTFSYVGRRFMFGQEQVNRPSRFLRDLPSKGVVRFGERSRGSAAATRRATVGANPAVDVEPAWDADIELDEGASGSGEEGQALYIGMNMRHPKFGVGDVVSWSGVGDHLKLTVDFARYGRKTILARFCVPA